VTDKLIMTAVFMISFCGIGLFNIIFPELMYRFTANNTRNKKATKSIVIRYKIGGCIFIIVGVLLIIATWMGRLGI